MLFRHEHISNPNAYNVAILTTLVQPPEDSAVQRSKWHRALLAGNETSISDSCLGRGCILFKPKHSNTPALSSQTLSYRESVGTTRSNTRRLLTAASPAQSRITSIPAGGRALLTSVLMWIACWWSRQACTQGYWLFSSLIEGYYHPAIAFPGSQLTSLDGVKLLMADSSRSPVVCSNSRLILLRFGNQFYTWN